MANLDRGIVFRELDRLFSEGTLAGLGDRQLLERYLTRRDEAAFEALVNLHGPMVLGLCRRILRDPRDIEDAFQATFLVLVRKASAIRDRSLLANWLYGVALKVATRARASAIRRRGRETPMNGLEASAKPESTDLSGIGQVLDQELSRLPGKYRVPLVMCYLRGQTHDQAAAELSWPVGTVRSRMARGRELLKQRLTRRGFLPSATILAPGPTLPAQLFSEVVPQSLVAATVEGAFALGSSQTIQAGTAASVLALTQGVLTSMKLTQLKWIGLALMTTTLSTGGAIVVASARSQTNTGTETVLADAAAGVDPLQESSGQPTQKAARRQEPTGSTEERIKTLERKIDEIYESSGIGDRAPLPAFGPELSPLERLEAKVDFFWSFHRGAATKGEGDTPKPAQESNTRPAAHTGGSTTTGSEQAKTKAAPSADPDVDLVRRRRRFGRGMMGPGISPSTTPATTVSSSLNTVDSAAQFNSALTQLDLEPRRNGEGSSREIRELEEQLKLALPDYEYAQKLHSQAMISERELQLRRSRVFGTIATLQGMDDDLAEEIENLQLERNKKKAMLNQARAQREVPAAQVARNKRLNEHKLGMVADEDIAKALGELGSAEAQVAVKEIELQETEMRRLHSQRRRDRIQSIVKWATDSAAKSRSNAVAPTGSAISPAEPRR